MSKVRPGCVSAMPRVWGADRNDRRTPTDQVRTKRRERSVHESSDGSYRLPAAVPVPNGRSDQPQPSGGCPAAEAINSNAPDGCPAGEGPTSNSNRRTGPRTKDQRQLRRLCPRCLLRRARSSPLRQHSLVGDRGRANHPPVMPVRQGSRTQVSMVGNLGQKPNSAVIVAVPGAAKEGLQDPSGRLPPNRSLKFTTNPPPGYRHNRPKVRRRRSSRFRRALRVS